jgi:hypothetical protein
MQVASSIWPICANLLRQWSPGVYEVALLSYLKCSFPPIKHHLRYLLFLTMAVPCPLINEILSRQRSPDVFLKYPTFLIRNLHSLLKRERNGLFFLMKVVAGAMCILFFSYFGDRSGRRHYYRPFWKIAKVNWIGRFRDLVDLLVQIEERPGTREPPNKYARLHKPNHTSHSPVCLCVCGACPNRRHVSIHMKTLILGGTHSAKKLLS